MHVLVASPFGTAVNPYIGLFREGLVAAGASVEVVRELSAAGIGDSPRPDVIHLHWIERYGSPKPVRPRAPSGPLRSVERLAVRPLNNGIPYEMRHWLRLQNLFGTLQVFRATGGRVAYTVHNLDPHETGSLTGRWALAKLIASADLLHVHDSSTAQAICQRYRHRGQIAVIPHGHYVGAYPNQVSRVEARSRLGIPAEEFLFVCLGLMRPYKGLEELLPAFERLEGDHLRLVVAGRPPDAAYVEHLRSLAGGDQRVTLEPRFIPGDELQVYLNAADVAVLPYRQITTSGAALLAFSFGLPVIAPAIGAFPNLIAPGRGVLYPPGQLSAAMQDASQRDWSAEREGIRLWASQFDWTLIGTRLLEAYAAISETP